MMSPMGARRYYISSWGSLLVLFLTLACNNNPVKDESAEQEPSPTKTTEAQEENKAPADISRVKKEKRSPAILFSAKPRYVEFKSNPDGSTITFLKDSDTDTSRLANRTFPIGEDGVHLKDRNSVGLVMGKVPLKSEVTICGSPGRCFRAHHMQMAVIQTTPEEFSELFDNAPVWTPQATRTIEWDLYFFDSQIQNFVSDQPARILITGDDREKATLHWNGALGKTEELPLEDPSLSSLDLRVIENPSQDFFYSDFIVLGKYKDGDKELIAFGFEKFVISHDEGHED